MASPDQDDPGQSLPPGGEMTFIGHLVELRQRLLRMVLVVLALLLLLMPFANTLYTLLAAPLLRYLPAGTSMIATEVASPFLAPLKLALMVAIFLGMPVILYQLWAFIAPGLYQREKKLVLPLLVSSTLLFYVGMAFAYYVVFPIIFNFFTSVAPEGVAVMTDIGKYLDFVLKLFFAFGIAFEVPVAVFLLVVSGAISPETLVAKRPYVIVGAFVVGMLLTPPDVFSQTLLAVPMWLLFELGVFVARTYSRPKAEESGQGGKAKAGDPPASSTAR